MQTVERKPGPALAPLAVGPEAAAALLSVSRAHVFRLIASGQLRTIKSGSRRLVPVAAIDDYLAGLEAQSA